MKFILEQSDESLITHSGLALVALLVSKTDLTDRLNATILPNVEKPDISNADVAISYLGLLCQGKSDVDCIEKFREDYFFPKALNLNSVPSSSTAPTSEYGWQHSQWYPIIMDATINLINLSNAKVNTRE